MSKNIFHNSYSQSVKSSHHRCPVGLTYGAHSKSIFGFDGFDPLSMASQIVDNCKAGGPQRRAKGICNACSRYSHSSWILPRKLDAHGFVAQHQHSKHPTVNGIRADYKSEEFDITEAKLESLVTPEGEAALVEEFDQTKPWWEQFPKRWVMVLLCFAAFLLCNMDRVSDICFFLLYLGCNRFLSNLLPFIYILQMKL